MGALPSVHHVISYTKTFASATFLWMREDQPREVGMAYWRGDHAQLVARCPGFLEYRQHHFAKNSPGLWPVAAGVETAIPAARRIDGMPEVTLDGLLAPIVARKQTKLIYQDEAHVFHRTIGHLTAPGAGRWYACQESEVVGARSVVLIRRRAHVDAKTFNSFLNEVLCPALLMARGIRELRSLPFLGWSKRMWDTPGVHHDYPEDDRYHAALVVGAADVDALAAVLRAPVVGRTATKQSKFCSAIHAYTVVATYINRQHGRTTLPQLKHEARAPLGPVKRRLPTHPPRSGQRGGTHEVLGRKRIPLQGHGPEDVVVDKSGCLVLGLQGGHILKIDPETGAQTMLGVTGGRPLGLEVLPDGNLLICDAHKGLLKLHVGTGRVEALVQHIEGVPLRFCSNATAAKDGTIWFTESTNRFDFEQYLGAMLEHRPSGRMFRRDPDGKVQIVLTGLYFPNGLTLNEDESAVIFVETDGYRLNKLWVKGAKAGVVEVLADNLPGFPDNVSPMRNGRFWVAMVSSRSAALDRLGMSPRWLRRLIWRLPEPKKSPAAMTTWAMAFDEQGRVLADVQGDVDGFHSVTGVAELNGRLYMASVVADGLAELTYAIKQ